MRMYRIADKEYITDKEGIGAKLFGGRWNKVDCPCLYTSEHISLAFLEKLVHAQNKQNMNNLALLEIEIPEKEIFIFHIDSDKLQKNWPSDPIYTQWIGEQILIDYSITAFSVPSALIPLERNYILNPRASQFNLIKYLNIIDFKTDYRLISKLF